MALYQPKFRDAKTGEMKVSPFWWTDFTIGEKRVRKSTETTRKTIALEFEKSERVKLERALAGLPSEAMDCRVRPSEPVRESDL